MVFDVIGPAVRTLMELRPEKRVIAVFPPKRRSDDLRRAVDTSITLGDAILQQSLLPEVVKGSAGANHRQPTRWG